MNAPFSSQPRFRYTIIAEAEREFIIKKGRYYKCEEEVITQALIYWFRVKRNLFLMIKMHDVYPFLLICLHLAMKYHCECYDFEIYYDDFKLLNGSSRDFHRNMEMTVLKSLHFIL
jgi:hypothetical protein